jgi:hypothetical protein
VLSTLAGLFCTSAAAGIRAVLASSPGCCCRYGRGEWSIEDARQVCAYVTGPHRLAPLLWRTARVAPRPPCQRGQRLSHLATSRFVIDPAQNSHVNNCSISCNLHDSSGGSRPSREYDLYHHHGRRVGGWRGSSDGPFSLSSVQGYPHERGRQGVHEGSQLRTADGSMDDDSRSASESGLVLWDEATAQQMYLRHQETTEIATEAESLSDYDVVRCTTATPESRGHIQSDAAIPCTRGSQERLDTGIKYQAPFENLQIELTCCFVLA